MPHSALPLTTDMSHSRKYKTNYNVTDTPTSGSTKRRRRNLNAHLNKTDVLPHSHSTSPLSPTPSTTTYAASSTDTTYPHDLLTDETQQFANSPQKRTPPTQHAEARHALHRQSANLLTLSRGQRAHYANRHTSDKRDENYTTGYVNTPTPHANMITPPHSENITPTLTPTPPPPTSPSRSSNEQVTHYDYTSRKPTPSKQNPHN